MDPVCRARDYDCSNVTVGLDFDNANLVDRRNHRYLTFLRNHVRPSNQKSTTVGLFCRDEAKFESACVHEASSGKVERHLTRKMQWTASTEQSRVPSSLWYFAGSQGISSSACLKFTQESVDISSRKSSFSDDCCAGGSLSGRMLGKEIQGRGCSLVIVS